MENESKEVPILVSLFTTKLALGAHHDLNAPTWRKISLEFVVASELFKWFFKCCVAWVSTCMQCEKKSCNCDAQSSSRRSAWAAGAVVLATGDVGSTLTGWFLLRGGGAASGLGSFTLGTGISASFSPSRAMRGKTGSSETT